MNLKSFANDIMCVQSTAIVKNEAMKIADSQLMSNQTQAESTCC